MFGVTREKDPFIQNLSNNVFSLMSDIVSDEDKRVGYEEPKTKSLVSAQSVEDSIKELIDMQKKLK